MSMVVWPDSGEMTRRIKIRKWKDVPNGTFGLDQTLDPGIDRWAKREPLMGLLNRGTAQVGEEATDYWWVRYGPGTKPEDITGTHVIEWQNRRFRILDVENVGDAQAFTRFKTKDLGNIA